MTDDILSLYVSPAPDIAPRPDHVTVYPADDGEGTLRLYAVTPDGVTHCLTKAPDGPGPAVTLTTPGFHGPTIPTYLVSEEPIQGYLGVAHQDIPAGAAFECAWRQTLGASVGWGEVAILVGPATNGNGLMTVAASGDAKPAMQGVGTVAATAIATRFIPRGSSMWATLAIWNPAPGQPTPQVIASAYPDPISSGRVTRCTIPGWKPSASPDVPIGDAQTSARPPCIAVIVP